MIHTLKATNVRSIRSHLMITRYIPDFAAYGFIGVLALLVGARIAMAFAELRTHAPGI